MIYRVEFRKDGSVASCVEVESQHAEGGLVCYVEAGAGLSKAAPTEQERYAMLRELAEAQAGLTSAIAQLGGKPLG